MIVTRYMRYLMLLIFMVILSTEVLCQNTEVGLVVNPNYAYRRARSEDNLRFLYESEEPRFGFEYGLTVIHRLSDRWALESGFRHTRMGYSYGKQTVFNDDQSQSREIESFHQFDFLNIPINIQLVFLKDRKVLPFLIIGLNNYFFIGEWIELENRKEKTSVSSVSPYQPGLSISVGIIGRLSDRFNGYFSPCINYLPFSLYGQHDPVRKYLYSIGGELGLTFRLTKNDK